MTGKDNRLFRARFPTVTRRHTGGEQGHLSGIGAWAVANSPRSDSTPPHSHFCSRNVHKQSDKRPLHTNFTAIFDAALNEYKTLTKQDLKTHPFSAAFENSNSPDSVMNIFRKQVQAFDKFCKGDDKLMAWLAPIVNILSETSEKG
jgi:hypothetical protein